MSDVSVYSARPEQAIAAAALLQSHGVACRLAKAPAIAFPWILAAVPSQEIFVDATDEARARKQLEALEVDRVVAAHEIARSLRWPALTLMLSLVGFAAIVVSSSVDNGLAALGALVCLIVLIASFRRLRAKYRT